MAKELCDAGRVKVNGKVAKPATEIRVGDLIEGEVGWERWEVRVLQIPKGSVPSNRRSEFVEVIRQERISLWEEI
ncbi:MAG: hypothetical protein YYHSYBAR_002917 [Candidatus Fervidibacter sacchari]